MAEAISALTSEQLSHYRDDGYVIVEDVFPRSELEEMNAELDRVVAERNANAVPDSKKGWLFRLGIATERTREFCEDPRLIDLVQSVVQPGVAIYSAKLVTKEPMDPEVCHWHQDDAFYRDQSQAETRMSVWIPLQDVTVEQGCLQVVPGSHRRGLQPWSKRSSGTCLRAIDTEIDPAEKVFCPMKAGSVLLFSALLYHGSAGNTTSDRRRAFIISYQEATASGGNADQWKVLRPA